MKNSIKKYLLLFFLIGILILPYFVFATNPIKRLDTVAGGTYDTTNQEYGLPILVSYGVKTFLSILGIIFIILMLYAGYLWMMAKGDEEQINKSKSTITRAIIGLIITVGSYAIWSLVAKFLISE